MRLCRRLPAPLSRGGKRGGRNDEQGVREMTGSAETPQLAMLRNSSKRVERGIASAWHGQHRDSNSESEAEGTPQKKLPTWKSRNSQYLKRK